MYLQMAAEEDKKMTDNWKADADGILIFVSSHSTSDLPTHVNPKTKDWFIFCCRRYIGSGVRAGPQAKFPGHRPHMRTLGNITSAMGALIHEDHPDTI